MPEAAAQVSPAKLHRFITQIRSYPLTARQVLNVADKVGAPSEIADFYKTFDPEREFKNRDDLEVSSELVELMREQQAETPKEEEKATEEF